DLPTVSPVQSTFGGGTQDVFVSQLNVAGSDLTFSSYLGGGGTSSEAGTAIATDRHDNLVVAGWTEATNFPLSSPYQSSNAGLKDAFVTKLGPSPRVPTITQITDDTGSSSSDQYTYDQTLLVSGTG